MKSFVCAGCQQPKAQHQYYAANRRGHMCCKPCAEEDVRNFDQQAFVFVVCLLAPIALIIYFCKGLPV